MPKFTYLSQNVQGVETASPPTPREGASHMAKRFDTGRLEHQSFRDRLLMYVANYPYLQTLMDLARWWTPAVQVGGVTIVLRHDDVEGYWVIRTRFLCPGDGR